MGLFTILIHADAIFFDVDGVYTQSIKSTANITLPMHYVPL